jgi:hypothetical protein
VYDLSVEDCHEFFANGILVHNSYAANTFFESAVKPKDVAFLEKIQKMKEAGSNDHTLWIEQQRRLLEKGGDDDGPIYLGRPHGKVPIIRR